MNEMTVHAQRIDYQQTLAIWLTGAPGYVVEKMPMNLRDVGDGECEPTLTLRNEVAQQLLDRMWELGMRPSKVAEERGELAATKAHLADVIKQRDALMGKLLGPAPDWRDGIAKDVAASTFKPATPYSGYGIRTYGDGHGQY